MFISSATYQLMERSAERFLDSEYLQCLSTGYVDGYGWTENEYVRFITMHHCTILFVSKLSHMMYV
jgi:hypothetical protein